METRKVLGVGVLIGGLAGLLTAWWLLTSVDTGPVARRVPPVAKVPEIKEPAPWAAVVANAGVEPAPEVVAVDPELPEPGVAPVTTVCKRLVSEQRRRVPDFAIMRNLRDGGHVFSEDDVACLNASGVKPFILDYAERHQRGRYKDGRPKP